MCPENQLIRGSLKTAANLKSAGFSEAQAAAIVNAIKDAQSDESGIATKNDIEKLCLEMKAEISFLKWGVYVCTTGIVALIAKNFL